MGYDVPSYKDTHTQHPIKSKCSVNVLDTRSTELGTFYSFLHKMSLIKSAQALIAFSLVACISAEFFREHENGHIHVFN
jgi:hypothetical protein